MPHPPKPFAFWLSDLEGSTRLLARHGENYIAALENHRQQAREIAENWSGELVETRGDSLFCVFPSANAALQSARELRDEMTRAATPCDASAQPQVPLKARVGVHFGELQRVGNGYAGLALHFCARICEAAHGGQILASHALYSALETENGADGLRNLGEFSLRDLEGCHLLFEVPGAQKFGPPRTVDALPSNLPAPLDAFIGRENELAELQNWRQSGARLLTLCGPGGAGKSRLCLQMTHNSRAGFPDGSFWIELAALAPCANEIEAQNRIAAQVARVLGLGEVAGSDAATRVENWLRARKIRLCFDNFEHLLAGAPLLCRWLQNAPGLEMLSSSREPLRVRGERVWILEPLSLPQSETARGLESSDAAQLLTRRARDFDPDFEVEPPQLPFFARLCTRLDGLPLALELCAPHLGKSRGATPQSVLESLEGTAPLRLSGPRDLPARHQTLHNAINWSFERLEPAHQRLFAALGVFQSGFTHEAARETAGTTLDELEILVGAQLLRSREVAGKTRFFWLETLREFACEKFGTSDSKAEVAARHAAFYLQDALQKPSDWSPENAESVEADWPNITRALDWWQTQNSAQFARFCLALAPYFELRGLLTLGEEWLQKALGTPEIEAETRGKIEAFRAGLCFYRADFAGVVAASEVVFHTISYSPHARGKAHLARGMVRFYTCQYPGAREDFEAALALFEATNDDLGTAKTMQSLGMLTLNYERDLEQAMNWQRAAIEKAHHYPTEQASAHFFLGDAIGLCGGDFEGARPHFEIAAQLAQQQNYTLVEGYARWGWSQVEREAGNLGAARDLLSHSDRLSRESGHQWGWPFILEASAHQLLAEGDARSAVLILGAAQAARTRLGVPLSVSYHNQYARQQAKIDAQLSTDEQGHLLEMGALLSERETRELAFGKPPG